MSFLPKPLTDQGGIWTTFYNFINEQYEYFLAKILNLRYMFSPDRTPFANEIASFIGAYTRPSDDLPTIRAKISRAIETHRFLPVFSNTYKPVIDSILGVNSAIVQYDQIPEVFVVAQSIIGGNAFIGFMPLPTGLAKDKGQIFIDVGRVCTPSEILKLRDQLSEICLLYFFIYIGKSVFVTGGPFEVASSIIGGSDVIGYNIPTGNYFQPQFLLNP